MNTSRQTKLFHRLGLLPLALATCLAATSVSAQDFDLDAMLGDLEARLQEQTAESSKRMEELKPALRDALDEKSRQINQQMQQAIDQGFVELESLGTELRQASDEASSRMRELMNSDEVKELQAFLAEVDEDAVRAALEKVAEDLAAFLELQKDQLAELKPLLIESVRQKAEILSRTLKSAEKDFESYLRELEEVGRESRQKLEDLLNEEQLDKLRRHEDDITDRIRNDVFET